MDKLGNIKAMKKKTATKAHSFMGESYENEGPV